MIVKINFDVVVTFVFTFKILNSKLPKPLWHFVKKSIINGKTSRTAFEFFIRRDEWRKHPMMTNQWRHGTPDLGIYVAFGIYVVDEAAYNKIYAPKSHFHSTSTPALAGSSTSC